MRARDLKTPEGCSRCAAWCCGGEDSIGFDGLSRAAGRGPAASLLALFVGGEHHEAEACEDGELDPESELGPGAEVTGLGAGN